MTKEEAKLMLDHAWQTDLWQCLFKQDKALAIALNTTGLIIPELIELRLSISYVMGIPYTDTAKEKLVEERLIEAEKLWQQLKKANKKGRKK